MVTADIRLFISINDFFNEAKLQPCRSPLSFQPATWVWRCAMNSHSIEAEFADAIPVSLHRDRR
jgi:hypothetical protein